MVTAQDLVDSSTREDLVDQAEPHGISDKREDGSKKNKTELAEEILAAEAAEVDADEEALAEEQLTAPADVEGDEDDDVSVEDTQPEVQEAVAEVKEAEADSDEDPEDVEVNDVLVRFTGKHPVLQTGGFTFKSKFPFRVMSEDDAQRVFEGQYGDYFRVATPKEAREFYS